MISLMCCDSCLSTAALIFFTCVWIPYLQLKIAVARMLGFVFPWYRAEENNSYHDEMMISVCLPVARFEDLKVFPDEQYRCSRSSPEQVCSICLAEFEKEDLVSQLQKCGHVFHMHCIEKWVDRHHFTCPLCRSFLFPSSAKCPSSQSRFASSWFSL